MKISIIIPVYNKSKYIKDCFESVINQKYTDFEVIVVDDGSTDNSSVICDEYAQRDKRFYVFHTPNYGVSHARNYGMKQASGDYITFIDVDDTVSEEYLKHLIDAEERSNADLIIAGIKKVTDQNGCDYKSGKNLEFPYKGLYNLRDLLLDFADIQKSTGIYGYCVAKLFPRKYVDTCTFNEDIKLAEDFDFYLQIYKKIDTVYFVQETDYFYLQNAENSTALIDDWDIDYFTQLLINIRLKNFLLEKQAYSGKNKIILDETICKYFYFVLYYCNILEFKRIFKKLEIIRKDNDIELRGNGIQQILLFKLFSFHMWRSAKILLLTGRKVRKLMRGLKQ